MNDEDDDGENYMSAEVARNQNVNVIEADNR